MTTSSATTRAGIAVERDQAHAVGDRRRLIPELGLTEYWYPALEDKKVRNKPVGFKVCGVDLVFFRGGDGQVKCLWNVCSHRGGSLMHGDCHFPGTISCPYHGWTYDGEGNVLAVLPEGPDSKIPGRVKARAYPTRTLRGMVFVWMGDREPAPIEEDVPPEFFTDNGILLYAWETWPTNWRMANENGGDAHVPYVHRDALLVLLAPMPPIVGPVVARTQIVNGRAAKSMRGEEGERVWGAGSGERTYYSAFNGHWPKHRWRYLWFWAVRWANNRRYSRPLVGKSLDRFEEWGGFFQHHLPAMVRLDYHTHLYTRHNIPIDEKTTRQCYVHFARASSWVGRLYERVHFTLFHRWAMYTNFSNQDFRAAVPQRYDTAEYLSGTDAHLVVWRRLQTRARGLEGAQANRMLPTTPAEEASRRIQIESGMTPAWQPGDEAI